MRLRIILLALAVFALTCGQAKADFSQFGTFSVIDGHGPNGTHQTWDDFDYTDPNPADHEILDIPADHDDNPYGTPNADIVAELGAGDTINELFGPIIAAGTVYAAPQMEIRLWIPNIVNPDLTKTVQATLRYRTNGSPGSGYLDSWLEPIVDLNSQFEPVAGVETTVGGWTTLMLEWEYPQIYESELITLILRENVLLDSILVETQCLPAGVPLPVPGAALLAMLGLGYAGTKLRRTTR